MAMGARFLLSLWFVLSSIGAANADRRVALVIGNSAYVRVPTLLNPANDASDVAASMQRLGFSVQKVLNAKFEDVRQALRKFGSEAQQSDIAVIFFAGHGMEVRGENWLVPVDAELQSDTDVDSEAINLNSFTIQVARASRLGLVIVDACRNNPFVNMRRTTAVRAVERGLTRVEPPNNILVAFSARDGTTASDGDGRNSPFTSSLLENIEKPGVEVSLLFRKVRDDVMAHTNREQQPFVYGSLSKDPIYLKSPLPVSRPAVSSLADATHSAQASECDRLAAHPRDNERPPGLAGVRIDQIDVVPAKAACEAAMTQYPLIARFVYQAGRVAHAQGNHELARKFFLDAASRGYVEADLSLGLLYSAGQGVDKDFSEARKWYEKSAKSGNAAGLNALGTLYDKGLGVPRDYAEARKWYLRAAALGDPDANYNLGFMYANGNGVPRDYAEARRRYDQGAKLGQAAAMNSLGTMYQLGKGAERDYGAARDWYQRAIDAGDKDAMRNMGGLYFNGLGVAKDYATARRWYEKAASRGSSDAMRDLASIYANGYGVDKDIGISRLWHEKARSASNEISRAAPQSIYDDSSPESPR